MNVRPLISLLHPTRRVTPSEGFPRGWRDVHDAFLSRADYPGRIEYVLSVHESRWLEAGNDTRLKYGSIAVDQWAAFQCVKNSDRDNCVDNLNNAAKHSTGQLLVGVADDLYPPEHWDTLLLRAVALNEMARPELVADSVLSVEDADFSLILAPELEKELVCVFASGASPERDRELMIAGAITRKRYERYGFILDPDFESMFSDNWYAFCARRDAAAGLCQIIERLDIQFEHRHPIFTGAALDQAYQEQNAAKSYRQGQALFLKKAYGTKTLALCFPGETFRAEIFWDRVSLLNHVNGDNRFLNAPFGWHSSNVYHTRIAMTRSVLQQLPDIDLILWVDDDNSLTGQQFDMLYESLEAHPELSGVVGWCWCDHTGKPTNEDGTPNPWKMSVGRQGKWEDGLPAWNLTLDDLMKAQQKGTTLITSDDLAPDGFWSGFPVVLLRGDCVRELGPLAFAPVVHEKFMDGFTGEDASFFWRARKAGMKFAVDLRVKSNHCKLRAIEPPQLVRPENASKKEEESMLLAEH